MRLVMCVSSDIQSSSQWNLGGCVILVQDQNRFCDASSCSAKVRAFCFLLCGCTLLLGLTE